MLVHSKHVCMSVKSLLLINSANGSKHAIRRRIFGIRSEHVGPFRLETWRLLTEAVTCRRVHWPQFCLIIPAIYLFFFAPILIERNEWAAPDECVALLGWCGATRRACCCLFVLLYAMVSADQLMEALLSAIWKRSRSEQD
jgi:hypothetical protein